jgi:hypothetical protein
MRDDGLFGVLVHVLSSDVSANFSQPKGSDIMYDYDYVIIGGKRYEVR